MQVMQMQKHRQARENSNLRVPFARGVVFYRFICKLNIMSILRLLFFSHFLLGFFLTGDYILRGCSAGKVSQCVCICLLPLLSLLFLENAK